MTDFCSLALADSRPRRQGWLRTDALSLSHSPLAPTLFSSSITFTLSKCKRKPSIFDPSFPFTHPSYASWIYTHTHTSVLFIYFMKMFLKSLCVQFLMSLFFAYFCQLNITIRKRQWRKWEKSEKRINMILLSQIFLIKTEKIKKRATTK